jgi:Cu+-exporting ATPase
VSEHVRFPIEGMTCASCVGRITKAVRRLDGVDTVKVDLGTETIRVGFNPARTSLAAVADAVERAGYVARLADAQPWVAGQRRGWRARLGW